MLVYLNGEFLPSARAQVSVDDRGFLFGDGVYEVIRVSDGAYFQGEPHLNRLERGLQELSIRWPDGMDGEKLLTTGAHLLAQNCLLEGEATVYVQITRGAAMRTHHFPLATTPPTAYLSTARFLPPYELREQGAAAITYPDIRWMRCDLKTVNLLPNVLAKQHAVAVGATEAIFVREGVITEGSSTNAFGVIRGEIRTYPRCNYILPGVTREVIIELAAELGLPVRESPIKMAEIGRLDELFVTGTTTDVLPIVQLDGRPVGDGRPGPITRALQEALMARIAGAAGAAGAR
jgi:D-alanine transaminase